MRNYLVLLLIFVVLAGFAGESWGETTQEMKERGVPEMAPRELFAAFDENPIAVVRRYAKTGVMVTGIVTSIGIAKDGQPYISIDMDTKHSITFYFTKYMDNKILRDIYLDSLIDVKKNVIMTIHGYPTRKVHAKCYEIIVIENGAIVGKTPQQQK